MGISRVAGSRAAGGRPRSRRSPASRCRAAAGPARSSPTARRAASPSRATLSLNSPRRASTSMSTLALTSSTISTRLSERSWVTGMVSSRVPVLGGGGAGRERAVEVVTGDQPRESRERLLPAEERARSAAPSLLEVVAGPGVGLLEQPGPALHHRLERGRIHRSGVSRGAGGGGARLASQGFKRDDRRPSASPSRARSGSTWAGATPSRIAFSTAPAAS